MKEFFLEELEKFEKTNDADFINSLISFDLLINRIVLHYFENNDVTDRINLVRKEHLEISEKASVIKEIIFSTNH